MGVFNKFTKNLKCKYGKQKENVCSFFVKYTVALDHSLLRSDRFTQPAFYREHCAVLCLPESHHSIFPLPFILKAKDMSHFIKCNHQHPIETTDKLAAAFRSSIRCHTSWKKNLFLHSFKIVPNVVETTNPVSVLKFDMQTNSLFDKILRYPLYLVMCMQLYTLK